MRRSTGVLLILSSLLALSFPVEAGHELPFYPSFYPHEIVLRATSAQDAAAALREARLHAVLGSDPLRGGALPLSLAAVESLGSFVVLTFDAAVARSLSPSRRCDRARRLASKVNRGTFVFHPYPVTPYHPDYLGHYDRIAAATNGFAAASVEGMRDAEAFQGATLQEIPARGLMGDTPPMAGLAGPLPVREGWFQAYALLAPHLSSDHARRTAEALRRDILRGAPRRPGDALNAQRRLVELLRAECTRVVLGYTLRREVFNVTYAAGIENVAFDAHAGLSSSMFIRTVKLKDFPWNGWLRLGVVGSSKAAWNPIGGFTDDFGTAMWAAIGDPALLPAPYRGGWIENRLIVSVPTEAGFVRRAWSRLVSWVRPRQGFEVPADALVPGSGTPPLTRAGGGRRAAARLRSTVWTSKFHDGTVMTAADALYPYAFLLGREAVMGDNGREADPQMAEAAAFIRQAIVGIKVTAVEDFERRVGDLTLKWKRPVIDVFLTEAAADSQRFAAAVGPWSTVPWHVLVLMEEAARRGWGAYTRREARARGIPWLDLVRDPLLSARLSTMVDAFAAEGYIPAALRNVVSPEDARARWRAMAAFYTARRHHLVTNGAYLLKGWTPDSVTMEAFRDFSYPLGVGSFDRYALPRRGYAALVAGRGRTVEVTATVERVMKFQRSYRIVRKPLSEPWPFEHGEIKPELAYVALDREGRVVAARSIPYTGSAGTFTLTAPPAASSLHVAVVLGGNLVAPDVRTIHLRDQ